MSEGAAMKITKFECMDTSNVPLGSGEGVVVQCSALTDGQLVDLDGGLGSVRIRDTSATGEAMALGLGLNLS